MNDELTLFQSVRALMATDAAPTALIELVTKHGVDHRFDAARCARPNARSRVRANLPIAASVSST